MKPKVCVMKPKRFLNRPFLLKRKTGCSCFLPFLFLLFLLVSVPFPTKARADGQNPPDEPLNQPLQITSRTTPVLDMAISADGRHIVYISGEEKPTTLWLASADPGITLLPEKLAGGPSVKSAPAISADSRYVAYVDTAYDVKGDIYIIDRKNKKAGPVRLTDRKTEDGGPCFSSDNRFLYFHQAAGNQSRNLFVLSLKNPEREKRNLNNPDPEKDIPRPLPVKTGGNAMNCALSANNNYLAFVSTRYDASGDIFVLNTQNNTIARITSGPAIDMYPQWHENSRTLYFTRIGSDTNHDGRLSPEDHPVICRIETDEPDTIAYPVTPLNQASFKPYVADNKIYFLSNRGGVSNCWAIAEEGYIRDARSAADQLRTAKTLARRIPYDPYKTLLAHIRVIEKFPDNASVSARAGYLAAGIFQELDLLPSALAAYQFVRNTYADILPESVLSTIRQIRINFGQTADAATRSSEKQEILKQSLDRLNRIIDQYPGIIAAEARIESVNILLAANAGMSAMSNALDRLDAVLSAGSPDSDDSENSADDDQKAQALFLKAQIYETTAGGTQVIETLRTIITQYPDQRKWVDKAVDRIISHILTDFASAGRDEKIQKLNILAMENRVSAPPLAIGALNRIGDLYYETGEPAQAKAAFQNVLDTYSVLTTQTAAARLSLAEILFREERFRAAIDLYEEEISLRKSADRIYQLARLGYIRKNISAGEFLFRLGEIPSARSLFKELIDYDEKIVEAHRGYIKCAAASGDIEKVLAHYRKQLNAAPEDPVRLYCTGLCLTYLNTEDSAKEAKRRIEKAIRYDGGVEYFHQTLGYVYEVLETVYQHRRQLERALMSYQKAYFLNDHVNNAENAANLELNLGNIYYLMGQYGKAFDFYSRRDARNIEFSDADTRIVFLKRYGESAFQNNDMSGTIVVFVRAADEIDRHIDPLAPIRAFDKLNRYINDTIIFPAAGVDQTKDLAETMARRQSEQNLNAAELADRAAAPLSAKWQSYKEQMQQFLTKQEAVNKGAVRLAEKYNDAVEDVPGSLGIDNARENLANLTRRIQQALSFAERLVELKAEISDRLGLAYQENSDFKKAAETFEQVFSINEKSGNYLNLARNRRSVAYNTYLYANTVTGDLRTRTLEKAADDFVQVLSLIDLYGVPAPAKKKKQALIDISVSTSLDAAAATQAARGFSKIQEKRLAETFISRIGLELGNIQTARIELAKQLKQYPQPEKVPEKDLYGVSLLYHRAGLLDNAMGDFADAFEKFAVSAQLCLKLENPVSAAQNISNMASAGQQLARQPSGRPLSAAHLNRIQTLDRQAVALLSKNTEMTGIALLMQYHNQMGIFYFNTASYFSTDRQLPDSPVSVEDAVRKVTCQQDAVRHFTDGMTIFERQMARYGRNHLETAAALYLNMGAVAQELGDTETAVANYEKALKFAETGVFPDMKWRALAGLGQPEAALTVLSKVPFARTGCLAGEIIQSFAGLVFEKLKNNRTGAALNLAEKISELERFNRMAPYVRPQSPQDKAFFAGLYSRLETIRSLENELAGADEDRQPFIEQRLETEKTLLADQLGANAENLPAPFKHIRDAEIRDLSVYLMALSETIEKTADNLAAANLRLIEKTAQNKKPESENDLTEIKQLSQTYENLVSRYQGLCKDAYYDRPLSSPPDFLTLLAPEPFDVMDLAEILTDDDAVARIFNTGQPDSPDAVFLITKDKTTAFVIDESEDRSEGGSASKPGANILKQKIDNAVDRTTPYIAYENPPALDFGPLYPFALSAKHLERCINSRKPFKKRLLSVPRIHFPEPVTEKYDIKSYATDNHDKPNQLAPDNGKPDDIRLTHFDTDNFLTRFTDINTLLIANGPTLCATVPTEPGAVSRRFFAMDPAHDMRLALERPLAASSALSLSVVNAENDDHLYLFGHLFSIYGCPSLVFVDEAKGRLPLVSQILTDYAENSGFASLTADVQWQKMETTAITDMETDAVAYPALYMGYQGMNKKESAAFAKTNFVKYVKNGRAAFDNKDYVSAVVMFENALAVANEIAAYDRYLPDLYKYARESAYLAGDMDRALIFAKELADLFKDMDPESEAHAEALLRLGLMHAKKDHYEKAIPVIERAVDIMSDLPPDEDLVRAVMDLGIVLENATSYETALSRFKTAADLSQTLNRSELLGEQYLHIGRVYDLRLNQYAAAIKNYEKALEIYLSADDPEKIAESKLNIGRCFRLLGNFTQADQYYDQSLSLIKTEPDQQMLHVKILIEKANNAWFQGRYEEAFKYQRQCYEIAKKENFSQIRVLSQNTEGLIWWTLGEYDKALTALTNALTDAKNLRIREDEIATTLNNMGLIYRDMGNYQKALETFDQAIEIDTAIGSKWGLAYDFRNKGLTFLKKDQPADAAALFDRAYEISTGIGNRINAAKAILGKGDALFALEDYIGAENAYQTARTLSQSMMIKETEWRSLFGLARVQITFYNDLDAAETLLRESIEIIEQLRSDIKVNQLKENFIANKLSVYETLVQLLADKDQPAQAFEIAERSRARNFIDLLGGQDIRFSSTKEQTLYKKQQIIKSEIESVQKLRANATTPAERQTYEKSIADLEYDLENVMIDIQLQNPQLASMVSVPPVKTRQLISYLEPETALLSYYLLENEIFCWILRSDDKTPANRLKLIRIPGDRAALGKKVLEFRRIIQNLEPYEKHATDLYAQLMAPLIPHLAGVRTLGISPHGALHYLSFATLRNEDAFLLDQYALFYVPSAAVLEYTLSRRVSRPYGSPKVLAVGNPDLGDPILDLPFAEQEVGSIQWNFPEVTILTRKHATKTWVVNHISDFDIIHMASHGEFDPVNPLLSAIKLADANARVDDKNFTNSDFDGNLEAGEIFGLNINADMVFLSACQTGLGKISAGDDVIGLNRSFFYAGTHTVISSLWRVSDVSTAVMIKTFYRLYMNQNKADCLRQAALHVKTRYPHPGYWGAFTLVGDYY